MKKKEAFLKQNRGSVLIAVLIILTFASVIALIVTKITITNIEMKEVESSSKKNFYNTEDILDKIKTGISENSTSAIKQIYVDMLSNYNDYAKAGESIQKKFQEKYLELLESDYKDSDISGKYDVDKLKKYISETDAEKQKCFITKESDADYTIDADEGLFTFKDVTVKCSDARGYENVIKTDIVIEAPKMKSDLKQAEFMKYALIADDSISFNSPMVSVDGDVYAGAGGISGDLCGEGKITGDTVITRGDIVVNQGTKLSLGSGDTSSIWAENIRTTGEEATKDTGAELYINGNSYVADDLSLSGQFSKVKLEGRYYGYNFQKNYGGENSNQIETTDAKYSSAIMINGKKSRLDMSGLTNLMISGRTFISRGMGEFDGRLNDDILMGESLSVKSNQLAYYVSAVYLDEEHKKFTENGIDKYVNELGSMITADKLKQLLDDENQVVPYYYVDDVTNQLMVNYYLNFAGESAKKADNAKEFFDLYYKGRKNEVNKKAEAYVEDNAIIIDDNCILSLSGNIMYRNANSAQDSELEQKNISIDMSNSEWEQEGTFFKVSSELAVTYKALQLGLTTTHESANVENARIDDKTEKPLFDYFIDRDELKNTMTDNISPYVAYEDDKKENVVILVDNEDENIPYRLNLSEDTAYKGGIIIATGDVEVAGTFDGLILAGGTISFASGASVTANEGKVSGLIKKDMQQNHRLFTDIIKESAYIDSDGIGSIENRDYIYYDNWTRN